ncbi:MAG: PilZ domain-containing protein [bacterium]|nr:MAG: PilZ domain-containing protein [bacterium]
MKERRKAQRVEAKLAISISGGRGEAMGQTLNISTNGVYFKSSRFIEPLTKVQLELIIPDPADPKKEGTPVMCDGLIVRVDPEQEDPSVSIYHAAIFFTYISESAQKTLDNYIRRRLTV